RSVRERRLRAACDGEVDLAAPQARPGLADRDRRGGTGGGIGEVRTFEVVLDTDPGGRRVRHAHEDSEGLQTIAAVAIKREIAVVGGESASHPAADEDTG